MRTRTFHSPAILGLLSTASFGLVQFLTIALYPALARALDLSLPEVILCFSLGSLAFVWAAPFWAKQSDRWGRVPVLSVGLFGLFFSSASLLLLEDVGAPVGVGLLILTRLLYGVLSSGIVGVVQAWWRDLEGDVARNMVTHSIGLNLGRFLAPLLVLGLGGEVRSILGLLSGWCLLLFVTSCLAGKGPAPRPAVSVSRARMLPQLLLLAFLTALFLGVVHGTLAATIQRQLALSVEATTLLTSKVLLVSAGLVLLCQLLLRHVRRLSGHALLWTGLVAWMLAAFTYGQISAEPLLWTFVALLSLGVVTVTPGYLALLPGGGAASGSIASSQTLGLITGAGLGALVLRVQAHSSLPLVIIAAGLLLVTARLSHSPRTVPC